TAGAGQAPARQTAILAGLPPGVRCTTINKVCGSGLKAVMLAANEILQQEAELIVAGGQESMSQAPFIVEGMRFGHKMGHQQLIDCMIKDGLWDPYKQWHMGNAGELCAKEFKISREEQDNFAKTSYQKAHHAIANQLFHEEIVPIIVPTKQDTAVKLDEEPNRVIWDKIPKLRPAFDSEGTITAANASKINDGAASVLVCHESFAQKRGLKPLARIIAYSSFAQAPEWFTTAPIGAIKKTLEKASLKINDIDLWEINEAFAVVALVTMKELGLSNEKVNVHGGAIALGHPIGASGARILTTLIHALQKYRLRYGAAALCIGGGEAVCMIVENLSER
ncbi:MAG: thiolase family protein, partial [Bdellovibrionaceae bacterium]|nr:thiolase family protein [Pseudobdellovibrionaceae bacterium]